MTEAERIAAAIGGLDRRFLIQVVDGTGLSCVSRQEGRARQRVRRLGLVAYCGDPHRWQATALGVSVRRILAEQIASGEEPR